MNPFFLRRNRHQGKWKKWFICGILMFSVLSYWMNAVSFLHKHNMDQLISQTKEKKCFRKKGHEVSWEEIHFFFFFSITCFAINLTLFHPFTNINSFLTQCSQIIRKDVIIKTARRIFLMIQSSGEKHKLYVLVNTS